MGFREGSYAKIWNLEDKGNYHVAEMSVSKKNKETEQYETEWANKFVRLVGKAHNQAKSLDISKSVKIGACDVTNKYVKEKNETYTNYVVFEFESGNSDDSARPDPIKAKDGFINIPDGIDDDSLPFN